MKKLYLTIAIAAFAMSCTTFNHTIPVEDLNKEDSPPETLDLDPINIDIDDTAENLGTALQPTLATEQPKPIEVTEVDSKPASHLLSQANHALDVGNYDKANILLDRALATSPREPKLWYKKAQAMYYKEDYRQAANMAMRSNTMTRDHSLKRQNWLIIANAREKMGDMAGAEQARRFAGVK